MYTDTWHGKASQTPLRESTQIYPGIDKEGISLDEIRPEFDQRLAGMAQVAPPQPTGRTKSEYVEPQSRYRKCKHWSLVKERFWSVG